MEWQEVAVVLGLIIATATGVWRFARMETLLTSYIATRTIADAEIKERMDHQHDCSHIQIKALSRLNANHKALKAVVERRMEAEEDGEAQE